MQSGAHGHRFHLQWGRPGSRKHAVHSTQCRLECGDRPGVSGFKDQTHAAARRRLGAKMQSSGSDLRLALWPRARNLIAPKQSTHSVTCAECADCSGVHADCVRAGGGRPRSREGATASF